MKHLTKTLALAVLLSGAATPVLVAPALAAGVNGIGYADLQQAVGASAAAQGAHAQQKTTYKAQIDQYQTRGQQLDAQLHAAGDKFQKDRAAGVARATLEQELGNLQQLQANDKAELARIIEPVSRSEAYVQEQIAAKLKTAVPAAMAKANVQVLLRGETVIWPQSADITDAIVAELNVEVPSVQIVPPADWKTPEERAAAAQQAGARGTGGDGGR